MADILLQIVVWITVIGLVSFILIYALLSPWYDPMGRHIILFMLALATAFLYAAMVAPYLPDRLRIWGWVVTVSLIMSVVWWRVAILVKSQIKNQEVLYEIVMKLKRKITGK